MREWPYFIIIYAQKIILKLYLLTLWFSLLQGHVLSQAKWCSPDFADKFQMVSAAKDSIYILQPIAISLEGLVLQNKKAAISDK